MSDWMTSHLSRLPTNGTVVDRPATGKQPGSDLNETSDAELSEVSQQFESLLLGFMIREMRATVPDSTLFPASMAEDIFTDLLDQQLSQKMATNGGIGISRMVFSQLKDIK